MKISQVFRNLPYCLRCVTGYVIFMVYTLIDHTSRPMSAREFSQLLYNNNYTLSIHNIFSAAILKNLKNCSIEHLKLKAKALLNIYELTNKQT